MEDKEGFIWLATDHGASRFDGIKFTNFSSDNGLPDNDILNIVEDSLGRIWFISFSAEPGYYYKGKIYNAKNDTFLRTLKMYKGNAQNIYAIDINTKQLYFRVTDTNNTFSFISYGNKRRLKVGIYNGSGGVSPIYICKIKGELLYVDAYHTYRYKNNIDYLNYFQKADLGFFDSARNRFSFVDIISQRFGWINCNTYQRTFHKISNAIYSDCDFVNQKYYLLSLNKISVFDLKTDTLINEIPININARTIHVSRNGNIWLSNNTNGIYLIRKSNTLKIYSDEINKKMALSLCYHNKKLYVGTNEDEIVECDNNKSYRKLIYKGADFNRTNEIKVWNNDLYFSTDHGLLKLKQGSEHIELVIKGAIKDLEPGENNNLIFSLVGAVFSLEKKDSPPISKFKIDSRVTAICDINPSTLWFGQLTGLYEFRNNRVNHILTHSPIDNSYINDIKKDELGNVWISTNQSGLFFYNSKCGFVNVNTIQQNKIIKLSSNICKKILIDSGNRIWVANAGGLALITYAIKENKPVFSITNYNKANGLPDMEVNDLIKLNHKFLIATTSGCYEFVPINSVKFNSKTLITGVTVNGNELNKNPLNLAFDENNLVFNFDASFIDAALSQYSFKYRILGLNNRWIYINNCQISAPGLPAGTYELQIAAIGNNDMEGPVTTFKFTIHHPWYKSPWFIAFVILVFLIAVLFFLRNEKRRIEASKNLAIMELKVLRAQMDPHFIFNSLSSIQQNIFQKDFIHTSNYISKFASILRNNLHYSSLETISLEEEIKFITNYLDLEKYRFHDLFEYKVYAEQIEDKENIKLPALMVQPLVENAIKHGLKFIKQNGRIEVNFTLIENHHIKITITDNGLGLPENFEITNSKKPFDSVGLSIIMQRITLLKKQTKSKLCSFTIRNQRETQGVISELVLPINTLE